MRSAKGVSRVVAVPSRWARPRIVLTARSFGSTVKKPIRTQRTRNQDATPIETLPTITTTPLGARIPIHEALRKEGVNSCPKLAENQRIKIANFLVLFEAIIGSDSRRESIHPLSKTPIFGV